MKNQFVLMLLLSLLNSIAFTQSVGSDDKRLRPKSKKWSFGIDMGLAHIPKINQVEVALNQQGFNDRYFETKGLFKKDIDEKHPKVSRTPFTVSVYFDKTIHDQFKLGLDFTTVFSKIEGFRFFYTKDDTGSHLFSMIDISSQGHKLKFNILSNQLKLKAAITNNNKSLTLYGGPSLNFNSYNDYPTQKSMGFHLGSSWTGYYKKNRNLYMKAFLEYQYTESITINEAFYSEEYNDILYESHFEGLEVPLSYFRLGIGLGYLF